MVEVSGLVIVSNKAVNTVNRCSTKIHHVRSHRLITRSLTLAYFSNYTQAEA